ncbi:MAG: DUF3465 domain-containing protein [Oculatellaceae cyanobacterium bins.114]|nr:DUF3465 domain-containing protein [Oculatellaceae cyanobacterium bins.114]
MHKLFNQVFLIALMTTTKGQPTVLSPTLGHEQAPMAIAHLLSSPKTALPRPRLTDLAILENAFRNQVSNIQVLVLGRVISILPDDNDGDRHQRFIVRLANSQTLMVAHNIDIAPRVSGLRVGDQVYVYGEYEWNSQGGVIHWTHHDPNRRHVDGWIQRNGTMFR